MDFMKKYNMKKIVLFLLAVMFIAGGLGILITFKASGNFMKANKASYNLKDTKSLGIDGIKDIDVNVSSGTLNIIPEESNIVRAELNGNVTSSGNNSKPELQCYKSGSTLYIKLINKSQVSFQFYRSENINIDVHVPSSYSENMKLVSSSGDININSYKVNKLQCKLSSGDLNMKNISSDTFIYDSNSGNLEADGVATKTATLNCSSGDINLDNFSGELKSSSSSGDTEVEYLTFNNNMDIHSSLGDVKVKLPQTSQFYLDAVTSSGNITCEFPITVSGTKKENKLQGDVGNSKNKIKLDASSGEVTVTCKKITIKS